MNRRHTHRPQLPRWLLWLLFACLLQIPALPAVGQSESKARIYWNARMDESHTVSLRTVLGSTLQVEACHVVQHGKVKREAVECKHLQTTMMSASPLAFSFSCDFEYQGVHYRLRGLYSANASASQQSIKCIPLTLGRDLMEQGGYQR